MTSLAQPGQDAVLALQVVQPVGKAEQGQAHRIELQAPLPGEQDVRSCRAMRRLARVLDGHLSLAQPAAKRPGQLTERVVVYSLQDDQFALLCQSTPKTAACASCKPALSSTN